MIPSSPTARHAPFTIPLYRRHPHRFPPPEALKPPSFQCWPLGPRPPLQQQRRQELRCPPGRWPASLTLLTDGFQVEEIGEEYRTASADCAAALDDYYEQSMTFGRHRGRAVLRAADADPSCALASALAAHFVAPRDHARAAAFLAAAADSLDKATEYERAVFRALSAMVGEEKDMEVAIERHFELLKEFPRDLMSLKRAQLICFYVGRPDTSLEFVQQVLPENQDQNFIYGMLAFPLLELGTMGEVEVAALKGLAINKNDFW